MSGKSSTLITIACHNIRAGKSILYMTHEGRPEDIKLKILANMLECPISQIFDLYKTEDGRKKLNDVGKNIDRHLLYIPYNRAGMTIEEVVPIIRMNQEEWAMTHDGKGFDLLVSDYPAILSSQLASKGNLQPRHKDQIVYNYYVQLALEYKFHSLLAIQTNREGAKVNSGEHGDGRLLRMTDVSESWDPIKEATNVITLNRSPEAMKEGYLIYLVDKSRGSETGVAIVAKSKFNMCRVHDENYGATSYVGGRVEHDFIKEYLIKIEEQKQRINFADGIVRPTVV